MTKAEIVKKIHVRTSINRSAVTLIVEQLMKTIKTEMTHGFESPRHLLVDGRTKPVDHLHLRHPAPVVDAVAHHYPPLVGIFLAVGIDKVQGLANLPQQRRIFLGHPGRIHVGIAEMFVKIIVDLLIKSPVVIVGP